MLASIYVNAHLKDGARQTEPADFIPGAHEAEKQKTFPPGVMPFSPAQMKAMFQPPRGAKIR